MPDGKQQGGQLAQLFVKTLVVACALCLAAIVVVRFDAVLAALSALWGIIAPLLAGAAIAYLLNLIMERLERVLFGRVTHPVALRFKRPVCLLLSIALVAAFVAAIVALVAGELKEAIPAIGAGAGTLLDMLNAWLTSGGLGQGEAVSYASSLLTGDAQAWEDSLDSLADYVSSLIDDFGGFSSLASLALSAGKSAVGLVVDTLVAIVFALYALAGRERVVAGIRSFAQWALSKRAYRVVAHIANVANECFSRFIFGQCLEGTILGCLCAIGMKVLGMPYAASIGLCVGVTSLVPIVGAWCGGIVGALMILSVNPMQAVWFVLFLIILQQIEGHFIYPNVVGTSVGVPSILVLVAVFAGGSLFGIVGILLGVPVTATLLQLSKERGEGFRGAHDHEEPSDDANAHDGDDDALAEGEDEPEVEMQLGDDDDAADMAPSGA